MIYSMLMFVLLLLCFSLGVSEQVSGAVVPSMPLCDFEGCPTVSR
jgi:hypothetical protein